MVLTVVTMYMLWFNFILGLNFIFSCFKPIIMSSSYIIIDKNKTKYNLFNHNIWNIMA